MRLYILGANSRHPNIVCRFGGREEAARRACGCEMKVCRGATLTHQLTLSYQAE